LITYTCAQVRVGGRYKRLFPYVLEAKCMNDATGESSSECKHRDGSGAPGDGVFWDRNWRLT